MSYASEVLADNPVGYYRCADISAGLVDSSGNARDCDTRTGSPTYGVTSPITSDPSDRAITVNGANGDWFSVPYYAAFDVGDVCSVECWLKRSHTGTAEEIIVMRDQGFYIGLTNDRLFIARANVAGIAQSTSQILDTNWHHCVVTKNGATVKQYIDTVDVTGTVTNSTYTNGTTPPVYFAADTTATPFYGSLDEIAIYGTALSSSRITAHYNAAPSAGGGGASAARNLLLLGVG